MSSIQLPPSASHNIEYGSFQDAPREQEAFYKNEKTPQEFERSCILETLTIGGSDGRRSLAWISRLLFFPQHIAGQYLHRVAEITTTNSIEPE